MEKEFIPYEQALALKELGFDEPCLAKYNTLDLVFKGCYEDSTLVHVLIEESEICEAHILAPTFSQVFRWFREKGYDTKVQKESLGLYFGYYWTGAAWITIGSGSYEEAELECLKKLIEIVKKIKP